MRSGLTEAQRKALQWLSTDCGRVMVWTSNREASRAALQALLRRGYAKWAGHPNLNQFHITTAGRAALAGPDGSTPDA